MNLYSLSAEYQKAFEYLGDDEIDEQAVIDTIEGLEGELTAKMTNVSAFFLNLENYADAVDSAAKKMAARAKCMRNRVNTLKNYLLKHMQKCGINEISCPQFSVKLANNPPAVIIDNEDEVPEIYQIAKVEYKWDKNALKEALKNGENIPGCHLESSQRLNIK